MKSQSRTHRIARWFILPLVAATLLLNGCYEHHWHHYHHWDYQGPFLH